MSEDRLTRIESKLDQLAAAMVTMARMEEKMVTLFKRMDKYEEGQSSLASKLHDIERSSVRTGAFGYVADKLIWIIAGAAVMYAVRAAGGA